LVHPAGAWGSVVAGCSDVPGWGLPSPYQTRAGAPANLPDAPIMLFDK